MLALVPWLPSLVVQADHSSDEAARLAVLAPLTASNVAEAAGKSLAGHPFVSLTAVPGRAVVAVLGVALLVAAALAFRRRGEASPPGRGVLLALLAVTPVVGLLLYSLQPDTSFILARNFSTAVPYEVLLVPGSSPRRTRAAIALRSWRSRRWRSDGRHAAARTSARSPATPRYITPRRRPPCRRTCSTRAARRPAPHLSRPAPSHLPRAPLTPGAPRGRSPIVTSFRSGALLRLFVPPGATRGRRPRRRVHARGSWPISRGIPGIRG